MRWNKIVILLLLFALSYPVSAQDTTSSSTPKEIVKDPKAVDIVNKYLDAIGGKGKMLDVKDRTTVISSTVQGMKIKMVIYQKSPNKLKQKMTFGEMEQVTIFDGERGVMTFNGMTQEILGDQLDQLKREADINYLPQIESKNVSLKYIGTEDVNGKLTHKIEFSDDDDKWFEFFTDSTNLKVKEVKTLSTQQGTFEQEVNYSDYRDVSGLKFPFMIQQKVAGQDLTFNVTAIEVNTDLKDELFVISQEEGK